MFSYRHAFHAGNHADVLKHLCLIACLDHLMLKPTPLTLVDTHAGAGGYPLDGAQARTSAESDHGVMRLLAAAPRLIAVLVYGHHPSASTQTMPVVRPLLKDLKAAAPGIPVALGGTHPSALPEQTLAEEAADYIVEGEGLYGLLGLLDHLDGRGAFESIPGLWRRTENGAVRTAPPRPIR